MPPPSRRQRRAPVTSSRVTSSRVAAPLVGFLVLVLVLAGLGYAGTTWLRAKLREPVTVVTPADQCVATANGTSATLTLEQSRYAAIITAESIRRGLPARAATIALATAMQESALRNLDHGDRDSVGLFQQRPSQGWGTVDQIMDPWYSAGKFYQALVKVPGWQSGDINDIAQTVQRSGFPEAYRQHVDEARVIASVLTGHSPAGLTCLRREPGAPVTTSLDKVLAAALGSKGRATKTTAGLSITSADPVRLWSGVHLAMALSGDVGWQSVDVAGRSWQHDRDRLARWTEEPRGKGADETSGGASGPRASGPGGSKTAASLLFSS